MRRPGTTQIVTVSVNHHITGVIGEGGRGDSAVPGQRVDTRAVAGELGRRQGGHADVQDDDLVAVHRDRRQIVVVLTIPAESKQRRLVGALIDNRGVLQIPRARTQARHDEGGGTVGREGLIQGEVYLRSNMRTEPSAPTDAKRSVPLAKAMSYTSLSWAMSCVMADCLCTSEEEEEETEPTQVRPLRFNA